MPEPANKEEAKHTFVANLTSLVDQVPEDSIISRHVHDGGGARAILFGFAPGQELSEHTASRPAIIHFLEGEAEASLGGQSYEAQPGTWIHMPANMPHSIVARTAVKMLLLLLGE